jgi:proline racemase
VAIPEAIEVVDSHTEGEPTRVVIAGWPEPPGRSLVERRASLLTQQDDLRRAVVREPRGHEAVVGALLLPPEREDALTGVVFFDNAGALGMCGHGLIGVVRTLQFLGRIGPGCHRIDTPVGPVGAHLHEDGSVTVENVPARVHALDVALEVPGLGRVVGDVAWGGNWFFLTALPQLHPGSADLGVLRDAATRIRLALSAAGIRGDDGAEIDHVELFGPPTRQDADARNFVLCPGFAYDRSPCGTGTSAKLAVLAARGQLAPDERWGQQGITGSLFEARYERQGAELLPRIRGRAFVTGRATLLFHPDDPFRAGIG